MIVTLMFVTVLVGLLIGAPIAVSLGFGGAVGIVLQYGSLSAGSLAISNSVSTTLSNPVLAAIPLYMMMAQVLVKCGIATDLFDLAQRLLRWLPGGLTIAGIVTAAGFATVSGSSSATVATVGGTALPEMLRRGVPRRQATGALVCAGTLGILIPPSGVLILYGFVTNTSVGKLFTAGILPGVLIVVLMCSYVMYIELRSRAVLSKAARVATQAPSDRRSGRRSAKQPAVAAAVGAGASHHSSGGSSVLTLAAPTIDGAAGRDNLELPTPPSDSTYDLPSVHWGVIPSLFVIPLVLGGIYLGYLTPVEAAAVGVVYGIVIGVIRRRLGWSEIGNSIKDAVQMGGMILAIIAGAGIFATAASLGQVPQSFADMLNGWGLSKGMFVAVTIVLLLLLGCFLDATSVILTVMPILLPLITAMNIDLIWFGILLVMSMEIGAVHPPVGINLYVMRGIRPDIPLSEILLGALPFALTLLLALILVALIPGIATWLPGFMHH
ncbi:MAG: TRAP-type C4-dicarboxylate transport system, large permease component [Marmoricola sp.]|jgi:C4-dicarboxylate transporter DctM subunit|nr:TRAP-type C4-dicarboxylate transport system, large permease component [Marmoricola sp.]